MKFIALAVLVLSWVPFAPASGTPVVGPTLAAFGDARGGDPAGAAVLNPPSAKPATVRPPAAAYARVGDAKATFSRMFEAALAGKVRRIRIVDEHTSEAFPVDGKPYLVKTPLAYSWTIDLAKAGVDVDFSSIDDKSVLQTVLGFVFALGPVLGLLVPLVVVFWFLRMMRGKGNAVEAVKRGRIDTRFSDVAGADEAKRVLQDVVAYLRDPTEFVRLGGKGRRGILLVGDPGNGKTLLARAVAGEADVPFFHTSGAAFQEMFAGVGAARVRRLFKALRKKGGILFVDEFESLGRRRSDQSSPVQDDAAATLNQLLTELDGIMPSKGIVVIAATNRPDVLDPAVVRPGRFDLQVVVPLPDLRARRDILRVSARGVRLGDDADLGVLARGTPGFSGARLAALVNEAALRASLRKAPAVAAEDLDWARDAALLGGDPRAGLVLSDDEAAVVAYHESGHALVNVMKPELDPIHKATVAPRGRALGFVASLPLEERMLMRKSVMRAELVKLMAGRAAEVVRFGEDTVTSGASADIQEATRMARVMVCSYGFGSTMASRVGAVATFEASPISQRTMERVDAEVEGLVDECFGEAKRIVEREKAALEALVAAFRERDTLPGSEVVRIVEANRARPDVDAVPEPA